MILDIAIIIFVLVEFSNIIILYFKPDFKYGNGMAHFTGWADLKKDEGSFLFTTYLVRWIANCKAIFLLLLIIILIFGSDPLKLWGVIITAITIGLYYITLYPVIRRLDQMDKIKPNGYSKTLTITISGFIAMFSLAVILHLLFE